MNEHGDTNRLISNGSPTKVSSKPIETLLDEVEPEPLTDQRLAAMMDVIRSNTEPQQSAAVKPTPEIGTSQPADLETALDRVEEDRLDDDRVSRILQTINQRVKPLKDQRGGSSQEDQESLDTGDPATNQRDLHVRLWLWSHRYPLATAAVFAIVASLILTVQHGRFSNSRVATVTIPQQGMVHFRGDEGQVVAPMFVLEATSAQPQAHGRLTHDKSTNKWLFYVAGLAPTNPMNIYRIWMHTPDQNGHSVPEDGINTNDRSGPDTGMHKPIALGAFHVNEPNAEFEQILDLPLSLQQIRSDRWWVVVRLAMTHDETDPTGTVVLVGKTKNSQADPGRPPAQQ